MSDSLDRLSAFAYTLYKLGLKQAAADYDYLVAWFRSTEWTKDGSHVGIVPAGNKTNSPDTGNCPIPYPITASDIAGLGNVEEITNCLASVYNILEDVVAESGTGTAEELAVINEYQNYTYETVGVIDEEAQDALPAPQPRENEQVAITLPTVTSTNVVFNSQTVDADSSAFYQILNSSSNNSIEYNASYTYHTNLYNGDNHYNYQFNTDNKDSSGYLGVQYLGTEYITVSSGVTFICNANVDTAYVKNTTTHEVFVAFKYIADNNDEYYYICGISSQWLHGNEDLSNEGYSIDSSVDPRAYQGETQSQGGNEEPDGNDNPSHDDPVQINVEIIDTRIFNSNVVSNSKRIDLFRLSGDYYTNVTYDSNYKYHTIVYNGSGITYYYQFDSENINNKVYLHYLGQNSVSVDSCKTFICHDSEHTYFDYVCTTNSPQNIMRAFKYERDNVYYYFVCDGTNHSWIRGDNLESEGYSTINYEVDPTNYIGEYQPGGNEEPGGNQGGNNEPDNPGGNNEPDNPGGNNEPDEPQLPTPFAVRDNIRHINMADSGNGYTDFIFLLNNNGYGVNFSYSSSNYWYAVPLNEHDVDRLNSLGLSTDDNGRVLYNQEYSYKVLCVYYDNGQSEAEFDISNLTVCDYNYIAISCSVVDNTYLQAWKCRITKIQ